MNKLSGFIFFITLTFWTLNAWSSENPTVAIGHKLPSCIVNSLTSNANVINIQEYSGKVILIDFWASWCQPCRKSFPFFNQLDQRYRDKGLNIVAIGVDENRSDAQAFLKKYPASFTVGLDPIGNCPKVFSVKGMPSAYLIDRNGVIQDIYIGFHEKEILRLEASITKLLVNTTESTATISETSLQQQKTNE